MKDAGICELISSYLNNTGSDDEELELKELRPVIDRLTIAFTNSIQTHKNENYSSQQSQFLPIICMWITCEKISELNVKSSLQISMIIDLRIYLLQQEKQADSIKLKTEFF